MKKDDMIRELLKMAEYDSFETECPELDQVLKAEWQRLSEQTYSEVSEMYYTMA